MFCMFRIFLLGEPPSRRTSFSGPTVSCVPVLYQFPAVFSNTCLIGYGLGRVGLSRIVLLFVKVALDKKMVENWRPLQGEW